MSKKSKPAVAQTSTTQAAAPGTVSAPPQIDETVNRDAETSNDPGDAPQAGAGVIVDNVQTPAEAELPLPAAARHLHLARELPVLEFLPDGVISLFEHSDPVAIKSFKDEAGRTMRIIVIDGRLYATPWDNVS